MNKNHHIDELLKESFEHFTPEAPDVWQGISKGVQASQGAASGATSVATVAKTSAVVIKAISAVVAVAGLVTAYVVYQQPAEQPATVQQEVVTAPVENENENPQPLPIEVPQERVADQKNQKQIPAAPAESKPKPTVSKEAVPAQEVQIPIVRSEEGVETPVQSEVQQPAPTVAPTVPVTPPPTPKTETTQPVTQTKDTPKTQPTKLPYNPNEGEAGFDKSSIPNVFTPNNDGLNDRFVIKIGQEILYHLIITDANGRMVFESYDKTNTWDGKDIRTGIQCQSGNYRWVFQYQFKESDKPRTINGLVQIIN